MPIDSKAAANGRAALDTCVLEELEQAPLFHPSSPDPGEIGKRLSSCLPPAAIPHTLSAGIAVSPPQWSDNNINSSSPRKNSLVS